MVQVGKKRLPENILFLDSFCFVFFILKWFSSFFENWAGGDATVVIRIVVPAVKRVYKLYYTKIGEKKEPSPSTLEGDKKIAFYSRETESKKEEKAKKSYTQNEK